MRVVFDTKNAERNFGIGVDAMAKLTGFNRRQIIMAEAGSILKTCASRTKVATASKIEVGSRLRALKGLGMTGKGPVSINAGIKGPFGRVFVKNKHSKKPFRTHNDNFAPIKPKYAAWQWLNSQITDAKNVIKKVAIQSKASAGLARGSWVLIADSLGIRLEDVPGGGGIAASSIAKARQARARGGQERNNGLSKMEVTQGKFFVTLINRLPYGRRIGLDRMFQVVISGRAKFMYTNVQKGFTGSLEQVAKRFPGWIVKKGVN